MAITMIPTASVPTPVKAVVKAVTASAVIKLGVKVTI